MNQSPKNEKKQSKERQENDEGNETDSSYLESQQQKEYEVPSKNQITEAIYKRYNVGEIKEEDENQQIRNSQLPYIFKIKNLDTGEEEEIRNQEEQQNFVQRISIGVQHVKKKNNWTNFWKEVQKNNQKLRYNCQIGLYDQVLELVTKGLNGYPTQINCKGLDDWRPIHYASYQGHSDILELLLKHGAQVNTYTKFKRSPLHIASIKGFLDIVKVLFEYNIDINAIDNDGNTALHFACENGYKQIIKYLISINCNIVKNKEGQTPIDDCCDESLKKIFTQYGFKENGDYDEFDRTNLMKIKRVAIGKQKNLAPQDFNFYKLLGKGSFGEVFLVSQKKDQGNKLYAMKVLSKDKILGKNLKRYALTQRNVMSVINHPFMVRLNFAFQTSTKLFLVMDYYPGGDLGKLIAKKKSVPEEQARNYIAELILAFETLHKNMIVFRDLKPDNVVLDSEGHCRLTDFGLSKEGIYNNTTESFCGSVAYLAPQILSKQGHSRTVDWYLLGLLLYQLIVGLPPYYNSKKQILFENIKRGPLKIPKNMSANAKDLIKKLLCRDPRKRLGSNKDSQELKEHPFFQGLNWQQVLNRELKMAPVDIPKVNLNETLKVSFDNSGDISKKVQNWTFIGHD